MIKAIETVYNGYRFRSRLEARWAVFFDTIGIKYEYEPEGFDLGKDGWYLPDFKLTSLGVTGTWCEIKPELPRNGSTDLKKFLAFTDLITDIRYENGKPIRRQNSIMICGNPWFPSIGRDKDGKWTVTNGYCILSPQVKITEIELRETICDWLIPIEAWAMTGGGTDLDVWPLYLNEWNANIVLSALYPDMIIKRVYLGDGVYYDSTNLSKAYKNARQARFEHGEKPRIGR